MTQPDRPIYIDQGNGTFKKYSGTIEQLQAEGWPAVAPAGTLQRAAAVSAALDNIHTRDDIDAALLTFKEPSLKDWETFKQFLATERAD